MCRIKLNIKALILRFCNALPYKIKLIRSSKTIFERLSVVTITITEK